MVAGVVPVVTSPNVLEVSRIAARAFDDVDAALLFGSHARGTASPESDIDLLLVSTVPIAVNQVRRRCPLPEGISITAHTWASLRELQRSDWSFVSHLAREGVVVGGDESRLRAVLTDSSTRGERRLFYIEAAAELDDLSEPGAFGANDRRRNGRIYGLSKRVCMMSNAENGVFEFTRGRALAAFADRHPDAVAAIEVLSALEPDFLLVQGRESGHAAFVATDPGEALRAAHHVLAIASG